jgi:hypothetical protein
LSIPQCSGTQCDQISRLAFGEYGYDSTVSCSYNSSSDLHSQEKGEVALHGSVIKIQEVTGSLPNGRWDSFLSWTPDTSIIVAASVENDRFMYGFFAGGAYDTLNKVQCEVQFAPSVFRVDVDYPAKSINVTNIPFDLTPWGSKGGMELNHRLIGLLPAGNYAFGSGDFVDPSGALRENAFMQLSYASVTMSSLYTSVLGNAFVSNYKSVARSNGHANPTPADILTGVQRSIEAVIDASLLSFGASQLLLAKETKPQGAEVASVVAKLGESRYVFAAFGLNTLLIFMFIFEIYSTKLWAAAPRFNVLDIKTALLIGPRVQSASFSAMIEGWDGDATNRRIGMMRVKMMSCGSIGTQYVADSIPGQDEDIELMEAI